MGKMLPDEAVPVPAQATVDSPAKSPNGSIKLGLVLGGGAARGWAHIGVLRVLLREGIHPSVIAGTSIGAVIGGCYAAGKLDEIEAFARSLNKRRIVGLMDFHLNSSGLLGGEKLRKLLDDHLGTLQIEELPIRFAAVATELGSGHEIWLTRGSLTQAMRASYALPGVFDAVQIKRRWLMDGALVNPIPVTTARVLGAEGVIAVNLNGDLRGRAFPAPLLETDQPQEPMPETEPAEALRRSFFAPLQDAISSTRGGSRQNKGPGLATVLIDAFNITQDRIARSRLAGDPPDVAITPRLSRVGLFDFDKAAETIELGAQAAERSLPDLIDYLQSAGQI